jgi:hypothetical protein
LAGGCASPAAAPPPAGSGEVFATGIVFADRNGNGRRDFLERGLRDVAVSNGREVVQTDWRGRYRLPVDEDTILFVVKPRGWAPPTDPNGLPRFYYVHKPEGSPTTLRFAGVPPTGPLPEAVDFPLVRRREPDAFRAVLFGDPQPYTLEEVDFLFRDVVQELVGIDAAFGLSLGDLVGDDLSLLEPVNRTVGTIGIPWYNAHGNHDMNFRAASDEHADETFERIYGPATYAFQVGRVRFVVLDDVIYAGVNPNGSQGGYAGGLTEKQLEFLRNYLETVPRRDLVVLAMHIPLAGPPPHEVAQRRALFEILSGHPHTLSISAHTHLQEQRFFAAQEGWNGAQPHHHLNLGTTSGSWWRGAPDETGIPHATMRCGAPNGYAILSFDGNRYSMRFKAARRPADYQMEIHAPASVAAAAAGETEVLINVFAGSERARVAMRLGSAGDWIPLQHVARRDPGYLALVEREAKTRPPVGYELPPPVVSPHLWVGRLPEAAPTGSFVLEARVIDLYGQVFRAQHLLRIE